MNNKNEKNLYGEKYDYSNDIIDNKNNNNNIPEENKGILSSIKDKIKEVIGKINPSEIYNKIRNKYTYDKSKNNISHYNKSGIVNYNNNYHYKQDNNNIYEDNDYQIFCKIDEYKIRVVGKEHIIFYKIELSSLLSGKNWDVYRSFQEINDLYLIYRKLYNNFDKFK